MTTLQTGLCFLPNGLGCLLASVMARNVFDRDFRLVAEHLSATAKTHEEKQVRDDPGYLPQDAMEAATFAESLH